MCLSCAVNGLMGEDLPDDFNWDDVPSLPWPSVSGALVERVRAFYALPDHAMGGVLHVVLDDYNTEDETMDDVRQRIVVGRHPFDTDPADKAEALAILHDLRRLTEPERCTVLAKVHGYIE